MQRGVYEEFVTTLTFVELLLYQQKNKLESYKNDIIPEGEKGSTVSTLLQPRGSIFQNGFLGGVQFKFGYNLTNF